MVNWFLSDWHLVFFIMALFVFSRIGISIKNRKHLQPLDPKATSDIHTMRPGYSRAMIFNGPVQQRLPVDVRSNPSRIEAFVMPIGEYWTHYPWIWN